MLPDRHTHDDAGVPVLQRPNPNWTFSKSITIPHSYPGTLTLVHGPRKWPERFVTDFQAELSRCGLCFIASVSNRQEGRKIPKIFCNQSMVQGVSELLNKNAGHTCGWSRSDVRGQLIADGNSVIVSGSADARRGALLSMF